ncbi:MAG: hypothetical protein CM1200mP28_13260 [Deltaproteobacteria bacterium]|nr:MAG: hypothetical protein CM1200mP28_13260 [Deltaproteobacteria bacterium]
MVTTGCKVFFDSTTLSEFANFSVQEFNFSGNYFKITNFYILYILPLLRGRSLNFEVILGAHEAAIILNKIQRKTLVSIE